MIFRIIKKMRTKDRTKEYGEFIQEVSKIEGYFVRHDVDKSALSAQILGRIAANYGMKVSFYFRWKTMNVKIMKELKSLGHEVSLHYESLSYVFGIFKVWKVKDIKYGMIQLAEKKLEEEIKLFEELFWEVKTIAGHGHRWNISTGVSNGMLKSSKKNVTDIPHDTDKLFPSKHNYTLIHPYLYVLPSRKERITADISDRLDFVFTPKSQKKIYECYLQLQNKYKGD